MKTYKEVAACFAGVVGQEKIIENILSGIHGYINGLRLPSHAFFGAAGLGKTNLMKCTENALGVAMTIHHKTDLKNQSLWHESADAFANVASDAFCHLRERLEKIGSSAPLLLNIDEVQSLYKGYCGPAKTAVHNFIKQALDAQSARGRALSFYGCDSPINVCHRSISINIGTNFPDSLGDKEAIARRFSVLQLEKYTPEQIAKITKMKMDVLGIRGDERTLLMVGRCGRGTCEAPDKISQKLAEIAINRGKTTVNKEDVLHALHLLTMFPRGLTEDEVRILNICKNTSVKISNLAIMLKRQKAGVIDMIGNLMSQLSEDNTPKPFVSEVGGYIKAMPVGKAYLENLQKDSFIIPA
jgi:hypothetical protein